VATACLGLVPSPLRVYAAKLGLAPAEEDSLPKRFGRHLEGLLEELYEEHTGRTIARSQVFVCNEHPLYRYHATLDAVCADGTLVEFKTLTPLHRAYRDQLGNEGTDYIPEPWLVQCHHQMGLACREHMDLAVLVGNSEFKVYTVRREPRLECLMWEAERRLWDCIHRREEPLATTAADARVLAALHPGAEGTVELDLGDALDVEMYESLGVEIRARTAQRERIRAGLLGRLGDAACGTLPDGRLVTRRVIEHAEAVRKVKAYREVRLAITKARDSDGW
jgi:predicted phage-related endonuclease